MLFNSFHFLFYFIIVTVLYFALAHNRRWIWLLLASCYFYMAFVPVYIFILAFTIVVDYFAGILIGQAKGKKKRQYLILSLVANIGTLCFFKYYNFFNDSLSYLLGLGQWHNPIPQLSILLPIGLSFHTFQAMSYTIEVYRGNQKPERHFGIYALYVMFYPQLVAGPIERPQNLLHQFRQKKEFDSARVFEGLKLMVWGLFKKLVIADRVAIYVDGAYNYYDQVSGVALILATIMFSFQVYCDFSGYSDIAIGTAKVMGYDLMINFKRPIFARSTGEFWKRWHISLSTWFKDYLYFPLGGNRVPLLRRCANLMLVFLISGLWHGANWTFVIWGAINGVYVVAGMVTQQVRNKWWNKTGIQRIPVLHQGINIAVTFLLIAFSRVFFRSENVTQASAIFKKMYSFSGSLANENATMLAYSFFAIAFLIAVEFRREFFPASFSLSQHRSFAVRNAYYALLILLILLIGVYDGGQFIYFQF
jgi:alginate O-acetyltransferase complex protein AlgI